MAYHFEPVSKQLTIVVGLTVVGFMAFGLALSFYRNILFEETLKTISMENGQLESEISRSQRQLEYFQSGQYKDKYAKENMGKYNPGEKVLVITQERQAPDLNPNLNVSPTEAQEAAYQEYLRQLPVYLHWELYLFERGKLEQLKRAL